MNNLWLLTEERPKISTVKQIIEMYETDFNDKCTFDDCITIKPIFENNQFKFIYQVLGIRIDNINSIFIKTVSGSSSFIDFLLFKQEHQPTEGSTTDNLIMAIEETKTSDEESRNTGVYQRGSKFVYINPYYSNVKLYMLYNEELNQSENSQPTDTNLFGTNILLTIGVKIIGKDTTPFHKFNNIDELITTKNSMRMPPAGNVPIRITKSNEAIFISGRLSKPATAGNIGHDPNIGALSMISKCIRTLGWDKDIIITQHGVNQAYIDRTQGKNKFLYICKILNIKLEGIDLPKITELPELYWHYEMSSEKMTSILLHMVALFNGFQTVYENHAGCERGYFKDKNNNLITLPKKDKNNENLLLPDVVLYHPNDNIIILIEGKKLSTISDGLKEIELYDSIENEFIKPNYKNAKILRFVSIFGGEIKNKLDDKILIYMNKYGDVYISNLAPKCMTVAFSKFINNL